ncbi:MAG TPA: acyl-CoA dehydrogenase family protein [Burkholderiaceae bacterium]|nr:acyl-CoA dehydrogenase family protein [Burkholderiaceae bacterium]
MDWPLTPDDAAFRDDVRRFLDAELTPALREAGRRCAGIFAEYDAGVPWHRILARKGWSVPTWPVEHGGTGWTPMQHFLFESELAAADAPPLAPMGIRMVGPVIIAFGTAEQKARWLPGIRSGDDYWAQGYSEPGAGSDLASLACRAVRDGDDWVIDGSKIWTTHAHRADRMFCLVRTDPGAKLQRGISFLCFDMDTPGITVRPILSISGDHEFNQVFFDGARVPASSLVGNENEGWTVAKYLLEHERGGASSPALRARLKRVRRMAGRAFEHLPPDAPDASDARLAYADAECRLDALQALEFEALDAQRRGEPPGVRPSIAKILATELRQRLTELAIEVAGRASLARVPMHECAAHELGLSEDPVWGMTSYLNDRAASIYAGTNEVQRNIIAARLLAGR